MQRKKGIVFNQDMDDHLTELYPYLPNKELAEIFGCSYFEIEANGTKRLGLRKTLECKRGTVNATPWPAQKLQYLKDHFFSLTNEQLAFHLQVGLTVMRNKAAELGLKRIEVDNWTEDQTAILVANYQTMGDLEIAELLENNTPRKKPWKRGHVHKKLKLLGLHRSPEQHAAICTKLSSAGGSRYTIDKNSSSVNMHPKWVAQQIAWRDKPLQDVILEHHPELIELKRQDIALKRKIKEVQHATSG